MFFKYRISFTHFGKLIISQLCTDERTLRKYLTSHGRQLPEIETASGGSAPRHEEGGSVGLILLVWPLLIFNLPLGFGDFGLIPRGPFSYLNIQLILSVSNFFYFFVVYGCHLTRAILNSSFRSVLTFVSVGKPFSKIYFQVYQTVVTQLKVL